MVSKYMRVRGTLDDKAILYRLSEEGESKIVAWDTKKSRYEMVFDLEGEITRAKIYPSKTSVKCISMGKSLHPSGSEKWIVSPSGYGAIRVKILEDYFGGGLFKDKKVESSYPQQRTSYKTVLVSDGMTAGTRRIQRQVYHDMNGRRMDR